MVNKSELRGMRNVEVEVGVKECNTSGGRVGAEYEEGADKETKSEEGMKKVQIKRQRVRRV